MPPIIVGATPLGFGRNERAGRPTNDRAGDGTTGAAGHRSADHGAGRRTAEDTERIYGSCAAACCTGINVAKVSSAAAPIMRIMCASSGLVSPPMSHTGQRNIFQMQIRLAATARCTATVGSATIG